MSYMRSTHITSVENGEYVTDETEGKSEIFPLSQLFPARDGTWLMVDWMKYLDKWYVTEGAM